MWKDDSHLVKYSFAYEIQDFYFRVNTLTNAFPFGSVSNNISTSVIVNMNIQHI